MASLSDWFPLTAAGITFTTLGSLKVYGLTRGFVGGRGKPLFEYVCGT